MDRIWGSLRKSDSERHTLGERRSEGGDAVEDDAAYGTRVSPYST